MVLDKALLGQNLNYARCLTLGLLGLIITGCGLVTPRPTPEPIIIIATPIAQAATDTPVVAPTIQPTETLPDLPTLPPPTITLTPKTLPSLTPSFTPIFTDSPVPSPTKFKCTATPPGGFGTIYTKDKTLQQALGCPVGANVAISSASIQMQNGLMVWASQYGDVPTRTIYAVYSNGTFGRYEDTWTDHVDPETTGETAPAGMITPARGFGKVWHNNPTVKNGLGFARESEKGTQGQIQRFERGEMFFIAGLGQTYIFINSAGPSSGNWRTNPTPF
jgi:hypothetical protein